CFCDYGCLCLSVLVYICPRMSRSIHLSAPFICEPVCVSLLYICKYHLCKPCIFVCVSVCVSVWVCVCVCLHVKPGAVGTHYILFSTKWQSEGSRKHFTTAVKQLREDKLNPCQVCLETFCPSQGWVALAMN